VVERSGYDPGTPGWIDIGTDVPGAAAFYGGLLGWEFQAAPGPAEETGGYGLFLKDGRIVAGVGPQQSPGPPFWTTYVIVASADDAAARCAAAGGTVVVPPMDVMTAGRMAVLQDQEGAFVSVWQPGDHQGCQLVNEPGALTWNERHSRDVPATAAFYQALFGWESVTHGEGQGAYTELKLDGKAIAGMMPMPTDVPEGTPPYWLVYFAVADADATVAAAEGLGVTVLVSPRDIEAGRFAVLSDPQGAIFGIIRG
jgi:predicted enzyme related to lactoylglutathione lyase